MCSTHCSLNIVAYPGYLGLGVDPEIENDVEERQCSTSVAKIENIVKIQKNTAFYKKFQTFLKVLDNSTS